MRWSSVVTAASTVVLAMSVLRAQPSEATNACAAGHVALTFDDGPGTNTGKVLDVLLDREVPATFFALGTCAASRPAAVARTAAEGHGVANHTYGHEQLTALSDPAIVRTVERANAAIGGAGMVPVRLVRPPYGATSQRVRHHHRGRSWMSLDPRGRHRLAEGGGHRGGLCA